MTYTERQNALGFYEASPKPSPEELGDYYARKYFQEDHVQYAAAYPDEELRYFRNIAAVAAATADRLSLDHSLLDLGCGEGFFAQALLDRGWSVACCDYSEFGISQHNPQLLPLFSAGDIDRNIDGYRGDGRAFGLVNLQNVLEHVIEPVGLLERVKPLIAPRGALRIRVPNDYSDFQRALVARGDTTNTWFNAPEHLSYFNRDTLVRVLEHCGYRLLSLQADFPIEIFLANPHANYWKDRSVGKAAHLTRVFCENHLIEQNIDDYVEYAQAAGKLGFGRELIAYATPV